MCDDTSPASQPQGKKPAPQQKNRSAEIWTWFSSVKSAINCAWDYLIHIAPLLAATAATIYAVLAYDQWIALSNTMIATEQNAEATIAAVRAWTAVVDYTRVDPETIRPGTPLMISVRNIGKTPAIGASISGEFYFWDKKAPFPIINPCPSSVVADSVHIGPLQADQPSSWPIFFKNTYTPTQLADLSAHRSGLILHGCIHYQTVVKVSGLTDFCSIFYLGPDDVTLPCPGFAGRME